MVQVVENNQASENGIQGIFGIFEWLGHNIWWIVFAIIILGLGVGVLFLIKMLRDERKERDDPIYQNYKDTIRSCEKNADKRRINKKYSFWNLLFLGLPIMRSEHSNKVYNFSNQMIGYYRGHVHMQDNTLCFLMYKSKFLFFENKFILKCPIKITPKIKDKKGKIKTVEVDFKEMIISYSNLDYKIMCSGISKDSYFWFPNYIDQENNIQDLREYTNNIIVENSHSDMVKRVLSVGEQQVEKAMLHNPNVRYNQLSPQKTKKEQEEDIE